ncbi:MAG: retroviral-like aspartic protease family protein [Chloroflexi bacterium]|nr:retroviral-like aspartic protease family protein [Chloroflexota bacterium]
MTALAAMTALAKAVLAAILALPAALAATAAPATAPAVLSLWLNVWFDGVPVACLVDTGAAYTVLSQPVAEKVATRSNPIQDVTLVAANGMQIAGKLYHVPNIGTEHIGWSGGVVVVVPAEHLDSSLQCTLGMNLLGQQNLVFDWTVGTIRPAA